MGGPFRAWCWFFALKSQVASKWLPLVASMPRAVQCRRAVVNNPNSADAAETSASFAAPLSAGRYSRYGSSAGVPAPESMRISRHQHLGRPAAAAGRCADHAFTLFGARPVVARAGFCAPLAVRPAGLFLIILVTSSQHLPDRATPGGFMDPDGEDGLDGEVALDCAIARLTPAASSAAELNAPSLPSFMILPSAS